MPLRWSHMSWVSPHMCPSPPVITRYWLLFTNITKHWNCLCNYVPWQPSDKEHLCGSERIFLVETFQGNGMGSPICHWFVKKNIITELCWWRSNDKLKMNYWTQLAVISFELQQTANWYEGGKFWNIWRKTKISVGKFYNTYYEEKVHCSSQGSWPLLW